MHPTATKGRLGMETPTSKMADSSAGGTTGSERPTRSELSADVVRITLEIFAIDLSSVLYPPVNVNNSDQ